MEIRVHSIQFKADDKLVAFIENRLRKLEQFHDKIILSEVFLRLDKNNERGNKITEVKMIIPGKDLFAKRQAPSFEQATDAVAEALRRQIRRRKGKTALA
jgi:putative sigma-54 modulation protein